MRIFLTVTRWVISAATSLHIRTLRAAVNLSERKHNTAIKRTDAAAVAARSAKESHKGALAAEKAERTRHSAFLTAAQIEATGLRRGVTL